MLQAQPPAASMGPAQNYFTARTTTKTKAKSRQIPYSTNPKTAPHKHVWLYIILATVLVGLSIWGIVALANALRKKADQTADPDTGMSTSKTPKTGSEPNVDPQSEDLMTSEIQLLVTDVSQGAIEGMAVWDMADTFLGRADADGYVTVTIAHRATTSTVPIKVFETGLSPAGTSFHCENYAIDVSSTRPSTQLLEIGSYKFLRNDDGTPACWENMRKFLQGDDAFANRQDGSFVLTYSFVDSGTTLNNYNWTSVDTVAFQEHGDGAYNISGPDFRAEIDASFQKWQDAFATMFPGRTMRFERIADPDGPAGPKEAGDEVDGPAVIGSGTYSNATQGVGDIRIGMVEVTDGGVLAYAYAPTTTTGTGSYGGDMMFNKDINWRLDRDMEATDPRERSGYSIMTVFVHELGHAMGLDHDASINSIMAPYANDSDSFYERFPDGIEANAPSDYEGMKQLYSLPPGTNLDEVTQYCSVAA